MSSKAIRVACRVRPLTATESANPRIQNIVNCLEDSIVIEPSKDQSLSLTTTVKNARQFHFDHVFHPHCAQSDVYKASCQNVVAGLFDGMNGAVLAYGATGSGKTHTMFGGELSAGGVIYQAIQEIFERKEQLEEKGEYCRVTCTFLEVYNEEVYDLLDSTRQALTILETDDPGRHRGSNQEGLLIKGLIRAHPSDIQEFDRIIETGRSHRFVASTNANERSSRSHAIITVEVEIRQTEEAKNGIIARMSLCDLAGSERAHAARSEGLRLREGGTINKSLLALGTVVQALAKRSRHSNASSQIFVPYRGSKLTRLLKDCIGGNCNTSMIFCLSPSSTFYEESINTLLFAMQAKIITVSAKRNEFRVNATEVARNQESIIENLRKEISVLRRRLRGSDADSEWIHDPTPRTPSCRFDSAVATQTEDSRPLRPGSARKRTSLDMTCDSNWEELQAKVKAVIAAKAELHRSLQDVTNRQAELEMIVRRERCSVSQYLMTVKGEPFNSLPVRIAGQLQGVSASMAKLVTLKEEEKKLLKQQDAVEAKVAEVTKEAVREQKSNQLVELLLENASLRFTVLDAEAMAADYHRKKYEGELRLAETQGALHRCLEIIRELMPVAQRKDQEDELRISQRSDSNQPRRSTLVRKCEAALILASMPESSTESMLEQFTRAYGRPKLRSSEPPRREEPKSKSPAPQPARPPPPKSAPHVPLTSTSAVREPARKLPVKSLVKRPVREEGVLLPSSKNAVRADRHLTSKSLIATQRIAALASNKHRVKEKENG